MTDAVTDTGGDHQQHKRGGLPCDVVGGVRHARTSGGQSIAAGVARSLAELARELQAQDGSRAVMQRVVDAAVREIPAATAAAVTLLSDGVLSSPAHSNAVAARVGDLQARTGEGPGVDTSRQELTVCSDDLRLDTRWPRFAAAAVSAGVLSVLSFQLFVETESMGALDVYADSAHAFDADTENTGLLLAAHAAIAMSASRTVEHLRTAIDSRDLIGQAKGVLMERYKLTPGQAFDLLVQSSQATNTKLRDVAAQLTATGELNVPRSRQ